MSVREALAKKGVAVVSAWCSTVTRLVVSGWISSETGESGLSSVTWRDRILNASESSERGGQEVGAGV